MAVKMLSSSTTGRIDFFLLPLWVHLLVCTSEEQCLYQPLKYPLYNKQLPEISHGSYLTSSYVLL